MAVKHFELEAYPIEILMAELAKPYSVSFMEAGNSTEDEFPYYWASIVNKLDGEEKTDFINGTFEGIYNMETKIGMLMDNRNHNDVDRLMKDIRKLDNGKGNLGYRIFISAFEETLRTWDTHILLALAANKCEEICQFVTEADKIADTTINKMLEFVDMKRPDIKKIIEWRTAYDAKQKSKTREQKKADYYKTLKARHGYTPTEIAKVVNEQNHDNHDNR